MSDEHDFIKDARKFGAQFKGLLFAADLLQDTEKHKLAAKEAEQRLGRLRREADETQGRIAVARRDALQEIDRLFGKAADEIAEKHRKADDLIDQATEKAARIISRASQEAAGFAQQVESYKLALAALNEENKRVQDEIAKHDEACDQAKADAALAEHKLEGLKTAHRAFVASLNAAG